MRYENDLPVLALAIESESDILITGDKDFDEVKIDKPKTPFDPVPHKHCRFIAIIDNKIHLGSLA